METRRIPRVVPVSLAALTALLPLVWIYFASRGSQEHGNDDGEIEWVLQAAAVLLLFWSVVVGTTVRSLRRALIVSAAGDAVVLAVLCATLALGYYTVRTADELDTAFWVGAAEMALRGLGLAILGSAVGFAISGIAQRLSPPLARPPVAWTSLAILAAWMLSEAVGSAIPTGRFQLSTHLVGWVDGDWLLYRPPPDCSGYDGATCGMYHATWQRSLPVLTTVAAVAATVGWATRRHTPRVGRRVETNESET